ncbi:MAG: A24 family peptidase [Candidatus Babeliales bacterium]
MTTVLLIPLFLCWGSFLNVIAFRLISTSIPFFSPRSQCPSCKTIIAWYDNIPLLSWLLLKGSCRSCKQPISLLYPFIEAITALSFYGLTLTTPLCYWPGYFIFFSALIISIRTDLETLLLSRFVTLWLIPFGYLSSFFGILPLSWQESIIGSLTAYLFLFAIGYAYCLITKKVGMGQGDVELLAFIGSCIGFIGWWTTLLIASLMGTCGGIFIMLAYKRSLVGIKIPFGPFLASGAMLYVLFQKEILNLILMGI